jgi:uncharacterized surface protein with fasciclin (FAS1) repeats
MRSYLPFALMLLTAIAVSPLVAETTTQATDAKKKDVVDTAVAAKDFKTLVTAVKAADLVKTLKGKGPFTILAPTDKAFAKIPKETLDGLLQDKKALAGVLTYHVIPGKAMAADVVKLESAKTVQGQPVKIEVKDDVVYVNNAKVIKTDIECTNGVIHVIDAVLLPPVKTEKTSRTANTCRSAQ